MRRSLITIILFLHISINAQTAVDIDGNQYTTINIGNQTWMSQNLNVSHFSNGDLIPEATTLGEWQTAWKNHTPAYCYPQNLKNFGSSYGKLYNWYAVNDLRGLAPVNYKIPSIWDWKYLINYFSDEGLIGYKIKNTGFDYPRAGYRDILMGFKGFDEYSSWWTSDISDNNNAWSILIGEKYGPKLQKQGGVFGNGISVRCILSK